MIRKAFDAVKNFNKNMDNKIAEISVKQSQLVFSFQDEEFITIKDMQCLCENIAPCEVSDIGCFNNMLFISFRHILSDDINRCSKENKFVFHLFEIIDVLKKVLCACPMLEYVVSEDYLKIYLDLNNIQLGDLTFLLESWNQDPFLELSADRPYLLYIAESDLNE